MTLSVLLARVDVDAAELSVAHPPKIKDSNKALIHSIACPKGTTPRGQVQASRWRAGELPAELPAHAVTYTVQRGVFDYPPPAPGTVEWHLNFADAHLFYAYGSGLFAQDEHQVAEHPVLASLREKLVDAPVEGFKPWTTEDNRATPVLVMGAERSCLAETRRGSMSIYGNAMSRAHPTTIRALVTRLDPPTFSNILAIEAIPGGSGRYSPEDLSRTLMTAAAGYFAAISESRRAHGPDAKVVIHTGFWGCGAYGGNKRAMALLQLLAARIAQVDALVFHAFDDAGLGAYADAKDLFDAISEERVVADALRRIDDLNFEWGSSDGN